MCTPEPLMLKVIVSAPGFAFASRIAWRSDPAPESFVFVTVYVVRRRAEPDGPSRNPGESTPPPVVALVIAGAVFWSRE